MKFTRLQYDSGAASSGGGTPSGFGPSFADLDNPDYKSPEPIIPEGGGTQAGKVEGLKEDGTLEEGYELKDGKPVKVEDNKTKIEGLKEDGTLEDGYERADDGTIQKIGEKTKESEETEEGDFWEAVEAITGRKIEVDYGDIEATSPEGVALRENALVEQAEKDMESFYKSSNPRAYAYYLHTLAGGTDEEFFGTLPPVLPVRSEFEENIDAQSSLLRQDLISKGVPEDIAQATIDKYIKDNVLTEKALKLYDDYHKAEKAEIAKLEKEENDRQKAYQTQVNNLNNTINSVIEKEMSIIVPATKQAEFIKFVKDQVRHDAGQFFFVQTVEKESLPKVLESLYYQFVKGDLKSMIAKAAKTKTVQHLKLNADKDNKKSSGAQLNTDTPKYVTFGEI